MLRATWKPVAAAAAAGVPAYYAYNCFKSSETFELPIRVRHPDGKAAMSTKTISLLSMDEVNKRLRGRATSESTLRPNGIVWNYANASLPSNDPIEDAHSKQIIQRDASDPAGSGDFVFFTVMDGHRGPETSHLLSAILINAVSLELSKLIANPNSSKSTLSRAFSLFSSASSPDANPVRVASAIKTAFTDLDKELINGPIRIFASSIDDKIRENKTIPDLSQHPLALTTMQPAVSGSCALMALFDTAHEDLYVACTGDARAVAGAFDPASSQWYVDVLTEDQTGRNPKEKERIQSEHPADEKDHVIRNGRVLGGLEPTRAFGDARYKWPRELHDILNVAFMVGNNMTLRDQPLALKTPPYVTARPEVTHRKISFNAPGDNSIRFLVMATDGLWDELSSEDVASLVLGHLKGIKGVIPKSELASLSSSTATVQGKDQRRHRSSDTWAFIDDNIGVHLIRNALGGGDEPELRKLVSIPAPWSRNHRDDITVTVVWWHEGEQSAASVTKAKL